ncbi:MAG TPA: lytic transglycosylase domain-containing protein [Pyrinomonadaceae bacterium]|nr:lytic transglycosylase domain-containing protein [Pyrinomonadaceae bacterium]
MSFAGFGGSAAAQESPAANKPTAEVSNVVPQAQTPAPAVTKVNSVTTAAEPKPATSDAASAKNSQASVVDSYKTSLNSLSALYQTEVQKLEKQNEQLKGLFKDGLVSRVELDSSDKALADARAKVEDVARQIVEANKPTPVVNGSDASALSLAGNQAWSTGSIQVDNLIRFYGKQHGVDPYLIFCLMSQESKFSKGAISPKGAQGLMQLMPGTAARYGVTNPYDVAQNISGGTRYLKDLLKMFNGRVDLALAGYNAGENAVIKYGYSIPPYDETRNYVKLIVKRYGRITTAQSKTKS